MKTTVAIPATAAAIIVLLTGCSSMPWGGSSHARAKADVASTQGHTARGTVDFTQRGDDVLVAASFSGLTPGAHGFHVHEKGDCSAPDGTSAGGHFNPTGKPHGDPMQAEHHLGDLPMLQADANGNARLNATIRGASLRGGATNLVGRSVVVHAQRDDFRSQPAGDSGSRVACGVIAAR
ncbi:MAG: superoxide dismutase family protein [Burkholderiaceae bacterium]|jgi:Cu-Zn family superoxide dismutase|nr:superoxide dismutase family protein [Burkholderiaceae bacterium]